MLNLPQRLGVGQGAEFSVPNSQRCKEAKAECRGRVTSQPPRGAASIQQRSGKAQRLRAGVG
jgi:hypothetical protein